MSQVPLKVSWVPLPSAGQTEKLVSYYYTKLRKYSCILEEGQTRLTCISVVVLTYMKVLI